MAIALGANAEVVLGSNISISLLLLLLQQAYSVYDMFSSDQQSTACADEPQMLVSCCQPAHQCCLLVGLTRW